MKLAEEIVATEMFGQRWLAGNERFASPRSTSNNKDQNSHFSGTR
jgi:hypothetical protein